MTGQGHSHHDGPFGSFSIELRSVNNRGFKLAARLGDSLGMFEQRLESLVRSHIRRGTVQLVVRWHRSGSEAASLINVDVITAYYQQLNQIRERFDHAGTIDWARLASLPGALDDQGWDLSEEHEEAIWGELAIAVEAAVENLNAMRDAEGAAMTQQLVSDLQLVNDSLEQIRERSPLVVDSYRERLKNKVDAFLAREGIRVEAYELLREVQIFADRSDVSEEITRLTSHIVLFKQTLSGDEPGGRKLDFVIQEMLRETNTIGSKASDAEIAHCVVEIKCALERMRELVQNIE